MLKNHSTYSEPNKNGISDGRIVSTERRCGTGQRIHARQREYRQETAEKGKRKRKTSNRRPRAVPSNEDEEEVGMLLEGRLDIIIA